MNKPTIRQICDKLTAFLSNELSVNRSSFSYETNIAQIGADSLTLVKIIYNGPYNSDRLLRWKKCYNPQITEVRNHAKEIQFRV